MLRSFCIAICPLIISPGGHMLVYFNATCDFVDVLTLNREPVSLDIFLNWYGTYDTLHSLQLGVCVRTSDIAVQIWWLQQNWEVKDVMSSGVPGRCVTWQHSLLIHREGHHQSSRAREASGAKIWGILMAITPLGTARSTFKPDCWHFKCIWKKLEV